MKTHEHDDETGKMMQATLPENCKGGVFILDDGNDYSANGYLVIKHGTPLPQTAQMIMSMNTLIHESTEKLLLTVFGMTKEDPNEVKGDFKVYKEEKDDGIN